MFPPRLQMKPGPKTIRASLLKLVLATVLPLTTFAVAVAWLLVERERDALRLGHEQRVLAIQKTVDTELAGQINTLEVMAMSPSLDAPVLPLAYLRELYQQVLRSQENWATVNLAHPDGQQILNLLIPPDAPLPAIPSTDGSVAELLLTHRPVIANVVLGPSTGVADFAIRVPVLEDGELRYILSAVIKPESLTQLLQQEGGIRGSWLAVLLDRNLNIVARSAAEHFVGQPAAPPLMAAIAAEATGWMEGRLPENIDMRMYYRRSPSTGWTLAVGVPAQYWAAGARYAAWLLGLALVATLGVSLLLASRTGRRIAAPIVAYGAAAREMAQGREVLIPDPDARTVPIAEVQLLGNALRTSAEAIRERNAALAREKEALEQADRAKDEFLAMLGHELRNPLAAAKLAANTLCRSPAAEPRLVQAATIVERQVEHMSRYIDDLLDVSRIRSGKLELRSEAVEVAALLAETVESLKAAGRLERHRVIIDADPASVRADRQRLHQTVSNLVHNAAKFSPAGTDIVVRARPEGDWVAIEVADSGSGFPPESAQRLFALFEQQDGSKGGLGLGLAIVKRLVEMQGGSVQAQSDGPGRGAVCTVRLPRAAP